MVVSPQARKFESVPPGITWMARRHVASCTSRPRAGPMGAADSALMHPPMAVAGHVREVGTRRVGGRGGRTGTRCSPLRGTEQRQVAILSWGRNHVNDIRRRRAWPMCEIRVLAFNRDRAMRGDKGKPPRAAAGVPALQDDAGTDVRTQLARADPNNGRRGLLLRTLDRLGICHDN